MSRHMLFFALFVATWTLVMLVPLTGIAQNNQNPCAITITACGNVSSTIVSNNNGCVIVDDGNHDDPPYPGILSFDDDKDDGQIQTQCPSTAPPPPPPPVVNAQSCTRAPPSTWYDPDAPVNSTASTWNAPDEGPSMVIRDVPINTIAPAWMAPAQSFSATLFKVLFTFEVFMIGLQAILHRDNIAHLFSSFSFKTFVATFFIYLMSNAPTMFPAVLNSFKIAGQGIGTNNTTNLMAMYKQADSASELFFCAAMASHIDDRLTALEYGTFTNQDLYTGNANIGPVFNGAIGHITFEFIVQALGMLVIAGAGIMFLSLALITAESYIVMFAGAFFLGFSATRFGLPYTQGYLRYTLGVGVKMFTYWVIIAVENIALMPTLLRAGTGLIDAASIQFGEQPGRAQEAYLVPAAVDVFQILAMAALTWFLPGIIARFICGNPNASAVKIIAGITHSIKSLPPAVSAANAYTFAESTPSSSIRGSIPWSDPNVAVIDPLTTPLAMRKRTSGDAPPPPLWPVEQIPPVMPVNLPTIDETPLADPISPVVPLSKEIVQASIADGPDPFIPKPTLSPVTIQAPTVAALPPTAQSIIHTINHEVGSLNDNQMGAQPEELAETSTSPGSDPTFPPGKHHGNTRFSQPLRIVRPPLQQEETSLQEPEDI